jgi:hypothetical protein
VPGAFELRITGLDDVAKLSRDLKAAGQKDLQKEMREAGKRIAKPAEEAVRESARDVLPSKGGLNEWVAGRLRFKTLIRLSGKQVGIRIKTSHRGKTGLSDLGAINRGRVRHPFYGDRDHWYLTEVTAGFVTKALDEMADTAREEFLKAVDEVARKFAAGG